MENISEKQELEFRTVFFIKEDEGKPEPILVESNASIRPVSRVFPDDLPEGWLVFNAPRPIYGHWTWTGDFRSGVFYTALDPEKHGSAGFIKRNHELDANLVRYVTMAEIRAAVVKYYQEEQPDYWPRLVEYYGEGMANASDRDVAQTFLTQLDHNQTVSLDGETGGLM